MNININFEWNPFLIIPALIFAALLSYFLYRREDRLAKGIRNFLFFLRWAIISILLILLLNPIIKHFENRIEQATYIIAIDNSSSLGDYLETEGEKNLKNRLNSLKTDLVQRDFNVEFITLDGKMTNNPDSIKFNYNKTDLANMLETVEKNFENRNLSGVLLVSDGLTNRGISPLYETYQTTISALGLGDTLLSKDVWIRDVEYNEIAFLDNYFPIKVSIQQNGFENEVISIELIKAGKLIEKKLIKFKKDQKLQDIEFKILASEIGAQRYHLLVKAENETIKKRVNNERDVYIEIIDGKEKILILALNPHPDIKAIKSTLDKSLNYDITTHFAGDPDFPQDKFDLVILHQVPNLQKIGNGYLEKFLNSETPIWFILGPSSDLYELSRQYKGMKIVSKTRQSDEVNPMVNTSFKKFLIPELINELQNKLPPMKVPFGKYELGEGSEIVLYQSVGRINTGKPLLAIQQSNNTKYGILTGDGLWSWKLYEYSINESFEVTDALISKMTQFLSLKDDKRRFRVKTKNIKDFYDGMPIEFQTEVYNDIFEPVYGNEIKIELKDEKGEISEYNYVQNADKNFEINGLEHGVYSFTASTLLDAKKDVVSGNFIIKKLELEALKSQADFQTLRTIASKNNGVFFNSLDNIDSNSLTNGESEGLIHSREVHVDIISIFWIFFFILILISTEWFTRKFSGAY